MTSWCGGRHDFTTLARVSPLSTPQALQGNADFVESQALDGGRLLLDETVQGIKDLVIDSSLEYVSVQESITSGVED